MPHNDFDFEDPAPNSATFTAEGIPTNPFPAQRKPHVIIAEIPPAPRTTIREAMAPNIQRAIDSVPDDGDLAWFIAEVQASHPLEFYRSLPSWKAPDIAAKVRDGTHGPMYLRFLVAGRINQAKAG